MLRRAGILRVDGLAELFDAAEVTGRFPPLERARVGIVTNGGGAGVLAVDKLVEAGGELAELSAGTLEKLDRQLPPTWSHANPVDIIGDATAERYGAAVSAVARDPDVDALIVLNCPTGLAPPAAGASAVAGLATAGKIQGKPILTGWLGQRTARQGRTILQEAGIASFDSPAQVARSVLHLTGWAQAQRALSRVPNARHKDLAIDADAIRTTLKAVAAEDRRILTEPEAKMVIAACGIPIPPTLIAPSATAVGDQARKLLRDEDRLVVKLLSRDISHKSDIGGVVLGIGSVEEAVTAAKNIQRDLKRRAPKAKLDGYTVQPMVQRKRAPELFLGLQRDPIFGPVILFGSGGTAVEVVNDTAIGLVPLDEILADDVIKATRVNHLLAGYRDHAPADRLAILAALQALSQLAIDFPAIGAVDINPLLADATGVIALDARIEIDPSRVGQSGPNPDLIIRPYPRELSSEVDVGGDRYHVRPIRPMDIQLYPAFFQRVSPQDVRLRFLAPRKSFSDQMLKRLTQLDYNRDMAFVALQVDGALAGISRLSSDPDKSSAEFAVLVRTDLQGRGLGWVLLAEIIAFAKTEKVGRVEGIILNENRRMLQMCREFGFKIEHDQEPGLSRAILDLEQQPPS